jgi:purine-binding chemotaxis protein CheW
MEAIDYTERTCIIVVKLDEMDTGLIVDEVSEVIDIPEEQVDKPPTRGKRTNRFIKGMGKVGKSVKMILNLDKLLLDNEKDEIRTVADET